MMGWRHKKASLAESKELWTVAPLTPGENSGIGKASLPADHTGIEPVLPPLPKARLSYRQVGYYRGRKIIESSFSLMYLH